MINSKLTKERRLAERQMQPKNRDTYFDETKMANFGIGVWVRLLGVKETSSTLLLKEAPTLFGTSSKF